jgi:hypothetical protein
MTLLIEGMIQPLIPNPSPQGEGSRNSCPLSLRERARVREDLRIHTPIQQR